MKTRNEIKQRMELLETIREGAAQAVERGVQVTSLDNYADVLAARDALSAHTKVIASCEAALTALGWALGDEGWELRWPDDEPPDPRKALAK